MLLTAHGCKKKPSSSSEEISTMCHSSRLSLCRSGMPLEKGTSSSPEEI